MSKEKLKNGLSPTQVSKAKEVFKQVSLRQLCLANNVPYTIIVNVLRGDSPQIANLHIILAAAQKEIKRKVKLLKSLPL